MTAAPLVPTNLHRKPSRVFTLSATTLTCTLLPRDMPTYLDG